MGGGALIDTVGFAAATAHRGVRLLRVPTTALSQADAAIGVKNSVNAMGQKNFLGVFAPPAAVLNDSDFLTTLSQKDWIGGVAEAVKVALIKDADFLPSWRAGPRPWRSGICGPCSRSFNVAPPCTWSTSPPPATPLSKAAPGLWTSAIGPPTGWSCSAASR